MFFNQVDNFINRVLDGFTTMMAVIFVPICFSVILWVVMPDSIDESHRVNAATYLFCAVFILVYFLEKKISEGLNLLRDIRNLAQNISDSEIKIKVIGPEAYYNEHLEDDDDEVIH